MLVEFIFESILSRVVVLENDSFKCKGYKADLEENNNENDLHYFIQVVSINESGILSGYISIDVNKSRQNPYLKLIFAIHNFFDNNAMENYNDNLRPIISYNLYGNRKSLNDWNNPDFFLIVFPVLFPYGDGGNIAPQFIKISLYI